MVLANGRRAKVETTDELWARVLAIAGDVRAMRGDLAKVIELSQPAAKRRSCGMRQGCGQRRR